MAVFLGSGCGWDFPKPDSFAFGLFGAIWERFLFWKKRVAFFLQKNIIIFHDVKKGVVF